MSLTKDNKMAKVEDGTIYLGYDEGDTEALFKINRWNESGTAEYAETRITISEACDLEDKLMSFWLGLDNHTQEGQIGLLVMERKERAILHLTWQDEFNAIQTAAATITTEDAHNIWHMLHRFAKG